MAKKGTGNQLNMHWAVEILVGTTRLNGHVEKNLLKWAWCPTATQLFSDPGKKGTLFGEDHF